MRIAILTSTFPLNREEQDQAFWILEIIRGLHKAGHSVVVYTQYRAGIQEELEGVHIERFSWPSRNKRLAELSMRNPLDVWAAVILMFSGTSRLPEFLQRHHIELSLVFWALPSGWYAYHALKETGIPYRVWALGSDINKYGHVPFVRKVLRRILRTADKVFADSFELSERIEEKFAAKCAFLATTRTVPISGTVVPRQRSGYTFLYVGRLAKVKGIDVLMEAAQHLPMDSHLTIVGAGPLNDDVRSAALEIGPQVGVLGRISDEELARELALSDCVVIPSRSESIPIVLNEALQFGKRLIVTDVGDMGYIVHLYRLGEVVPAQDAGALEYAMKRAANGEDVADYEPNGWREARRLFDPNTVIEKLATPLKP